MPETQRVYTVASDQELRSDSYRNRLKVAVRNEAISQREWPTVIQDMFLEEDGRGTRYQFAPLPYEVPLIDDLWSSDRFVRTFLLSQGRKNLVAERPLDLFFRVKRPEIARHFGR